MQWLIDLVIEAIGIPPTFIDRGDPGVVDFSTLDFTLTPPWHDLSLAHIVPAGAVAVALALTIEATVVENTIKFRKDGNTGLVNMSQGRTQIANFAYTADIVVPVDDTRIIEYQVTPANWTVISMSVKGWWL